MYQTSGKISADYLNEMITRLGLFVPRRNDEENDAAIGWRLLTTTRCLISARLLSVWGLISGGKLILTNQTSELY